MMHSNSPRRKRCLAVLLVLINLVLPTAATQAQGDNPMNDIQHYFVRLIGTRPGWPDKMTADESRIMGEHFVYLRRLVDEKKVLMAGPVSDPVFGLVVLQVNSEAEAREIMDTEPSVVQGVHTYEMSPMTASLMAEHLSTRRYVKNPTDQLICKEITVPVSRDEVWKAWTTEEGVKTFFSPNVKVDCRVGGPFEVYFDMSQPVGDRGSEGCRILSYVPGEMLSLEWNAPPSFGPLRYIYTQVVITFEKVSESETRVVLRHLGWGEGEEWKAVYDYFDRAWGFVMANLEKRFEEAPDNSGK